MIWSGPAYAIGSVLIGGPAWRTVTITSSEAVVPVLLVTVKRKVLSPRVRRLTLVDAWFGELKVAEPETSVHVYSCT